MHTNTLAFRDQQFLWPTHQRVKSYERGIHVIDPSNIGGGWRGLTIYIYLFAPQQGIGIVQYIARGGAGVGSVGGVTIAITISIYTIPYQY